MHPSTLPDEGLIASYNGAAFLPVYPQFGVVDQWRIGADGITLSPDGEWLYYTSLAARTWWKVPTANLLKDPRPATGDALAAWSARRSVVYLGRAPSHADGYESDTLGNVYLSAPELSSIYVWNPKDEQMKLLVRDELIQWPDTLAVSRDKKLYFTVNQSWLCVFIFFWFGYQFIANYVLATARRTTTMALTVAPSRMRSFLSRLRVAALSSSKSCPSSPDTNMDASIYDALCSLTYLLHLKNLSVLFYVAAYFTSLHDPID
jgi:hypothetical protein